MTAPIEKQAEDGPVWRVTRHVALGAIALGMLLVGLILWGARAQISGAVIAPGQLTPAQERQVVQHPTGGVIAQVLVSDGDHVVAGDVVMILEGQPLKSQLAVVERALFELMARQVRLMAERDQKDVIAFPEALRDAAAGRPDVAELMLGQKALFQARQQSAAQEVAQLQKRIAQLQQQMRGMRAQTQALATQRALLQQQLTQQEGLLAKGLAQSNAVLETRGAIARVQGGMAELAAAEAEAEGRITEIELQILQRGTARREDAIARLRDLRHREQEVIAERAALVADIEKLHLRAPMSGIVYDTGPQTVRAVLQPAEPVLYIVPQDGPLRVTAQITPRDIDYIQIGQEVSLRFSTLSRRNTPVLSGQVAQISADVIENTKDTGAHYRVEITLSSDQIAMRESPSRLVPGMPVEVFVHTGTHTPLRYLIKPVADYFARAFRAA